MQEYIIKFYHEDSDHWESRQAQVRIFNQNDVKTYKWMSGHDTPANWIGYTDKNPGPGYDIRLHQWKIVCDAETMTALKLGNEIKVVSSTKVLSER